MKAESGEQGPTPTDDQIDDQITESLAVSVPKIWLVRRRFAEQALELPSIVISS